MHGLNKFARTKKYNGVLLPTSFWELIPDHLEGVAARTERFASVLGMGAIGRILGLFHDLGKFDPRFYERIATPAAPSFDHAAMGGRMADLGTRGLFTQVVLGHHRYVPEDEEPCNASGHLNGTRDRLTAAAGHVCDQASIPSNAETEAACAVVYERVRLALESAFADPEARRRFEPMFFFGVQKFLYSCLVDADYLDTEKFHRGTEREKGSESLDVIRGRLMRYQGELAAAGSGTAKRWMVDMRNDLWSSALECAAGPGDLFTITSPTGSGKTLAYMALALDKAVREGKDRVIVVLPYCSIITQVCEMLRRAVGSKNVLEHHSGYDLEEQTRRDKRLGGGFGGEEKRIREAFENWDAPVVVTTRVQFDESFFCRYPGRSRRVHNMANSVVVFDEVQATPRDKTLPFVGELHVLRSLFRSTLILSTATQPAYGYGRERSWGLAGAIEVVREPGKYFNLASQRVVPKDLGMISSRRLAERLAVCRQVLCVVNTRENAGIVSGELTRMGVKHVHLSTLIHKRRVRWVLRKVKGMLARGEEVRLVTTPIVEAGVDLDFPEGYSERCPLDSRYQRMGRVNRHGNRPQETMWIFDLSDGNRNRGYSRGNSDTESAMYACGDFKMESLETMVLYYERFLKERGRELDGEGMVPSPKRTGVSGCRVVTSPVDGKTKVGRTSFELYDRFKYIGGRVSVVVPLSARCRKALDEVRDSLGKGLYPAKRLMSVVQDYMVSIYEYEFDELVAKADMEELNGFWVLRDLSWYDEGGVGLMVWDLPCHGGGR